MRNLIIKKTCLTQFRTLRRLAFLVGIVEIFLLQPSMQEDGDAIAAVSIGKTHTRLRVIRDSPESLIVRLNRLRKGGKIEDIAHASLAFHQWTTLEHDFRRKEFFIYDRQAGKLLVAVDAPGYINKTRVLYEGISRHVQATAYDWIRREYYWGDPSFQAIFRLSIARLCRGVTCMTSLSRRRQSKTTRRRHRNVMASVETVIGQEVFNPYGMTVDPVRGFLYWSDDGVSRSIYSSTLDGGRRKVLVSNLIRPSGLTLDYKQHRLFWIDRMSTFSVISSCDLTRPMCFPKRITDVYKSQLYDLDYYKGFLIMADHFDRLVVYNEENAQLLRQHWLGKAHGVNICAKDRQEYKDGPNYLPHLPKSGIVFSDVTTNGLILLASEKSGVLMVSRTFSMGRDALTPYLFLSEVGVTTMAVDVTRRQLFYFKRPDKTIYKVTIPINVNQSRVPIVTSCVTSWIDDVTAMAIDWTSGNLYWLDSGYRRLMMSNSAGQFPTVIHYKDISRPQDLVIHSQKKLLFWSDMSDPDPRIERSRLDGKHRRVILGKNDFYERPHALAIDLQRSRLYWSDGSFLCSATLNGKLVEDCKPRDLMSRPAIKAIDIMHNYVIWTDFIGGLRLAQTDQEFPLTGSTGSSSWFGDNYYSDVIYVHTSKQPEEENPCANHGSYPEPLVGKNKQSRYGRRITNTSLIAMGNRRLNLDVATQSQFLKPRSVEISPVLRYNRCSQLCIPTSQLPKCACSVGYWKKHGDECVPGVTRDFFLVITDINTGKLFRQFALLPHYYAIPTYGDTKAFAVTLDETARKLYWIDNRRHTNMIITSDFSGKQQSIVLAGNDFNMTSIKVAFNLLYILTSSGHVMVMCLTSGIFTDVINDKDITVNAMFIDKRKRLLYLSASRNLHGSKHVFNPDPKEGVILRSNLDGSGLEVVYRGQGMPVGVAVHKGDVYWVDAENKAIYSVPLTKKEIKGNTPSSDAIFRKHFNKQVKFPRGISRSNGYPSTATLESSGVTTPRSPSSLQPRVVRQLAETSKAREMVITPDGDIFITDDSAQALKVTHIKGTNPPEDAGFPHLNRLGGIAYFDSRNKVEPWPTKSSDHNDCSGISVPLPGANHSTCLCGTEVRLQSQRCKNKLNQFYRMTANQQGLCHVTPLTNGEVDGPDVNNYVMSGQEMSVSCIPGYLMSDGKVSSEKRLCINGRWNSTAVCRKSLGYHVHGNSTRGYVVFIESMPFIVPRGIHRVDVIAIGGGGGGYDPCNSNLFGQRSRAGMGGVTKFGYYLRAYGGQGGTRDQGGRGGRSRNLFGGKGGDSSACMGGGAAGETRRPEICRLGTTSCPFCGAGGALVRCHKCPMRPGGCSGRGSLVQGKEDADSWGGGATGVNGGWGGGGGGYSRKWVRVSPFAKVEVKVGKMGFPSARPASDGVVVVAWGDSIDQVVEMGEARRICKSFVYEDRLVTGDEICDYRNEAY